MSRVSIIVPVYNVEKYLAKCLDSIKNQTLKDIEIICVDDGSTDKSKEILDSYARKDSRFRVLHKDNEGYGKAMNVGMSLATGDYIGFVESDDFIAKNMYEELYLKATEFDLDYVKSDFFWYWGNNGFKIYATTLNQKKDYNRIIENSEWNIFIDSFTSHWTGLYKKSFLDKYAIRYNETPGASYQDTGFLVWISLYFRRAMVLDKAFYMYRQDNINSSVKNPLKIMDLDYEYDYIIRKMNEEKLYDKIKYVNYLRLRAQRGTIKRISDEYKLYYSKYILDYYDKEKYNIAFDIFGDKEIIIEWLNNLKKSPEEYCNQLISKKKLTDNFFDKNNKLAIIGAGHYAEKVIQNLIFNNYENMICGVYVSCNAKLQSIFGVTPKNIFQLDYHDNIILIIAVKKYSTNYYEILEILNRLEIKKYIGYDDILNWDFHIRW